jgi:addiction module HigA family antidote
MLEVAPKSTKASHLPSWRARRRLSGEPLGLSVNALAMALRVPATRMGAVVKGERAVTADTALRLARFFGTSPEFWLNLQAMHDLTNARLESGVAIPRDVRPRVA